MVEPLTPPTQSSKSSKKPKSLTSQYSEENLQELLALFPNFKTKDESVQVVESLRNLAEFICYSEQNKLNYFDVLMATDVLLVDMPRILALDHK